MTPLFGLLILERDPLTYSTFPGLLQAWLQDAGGFAALGLAVYLLYALMTPADTSASVKARTAVTGFMLVMAVLTILCYSALAFMLMTNKGADQTPVKVYSSVGFFKPDPPRFSTAAQPLALMFGGLFAILGIGQPFLAGMAKVRFRRLWALTKVGFKEAIRNRLFWVFLLFLIPFLFPIKWFIPSKPEDELRGIIGWSSLAMTVLLLFTAALLAAFSIPNDIKNQNIYTIITKPVERFEIVFGRFLGYVYLMTLALLAMTAVGWVLIVSAKLDPKAQDETYMARMPVRGGLSFMSRKGMSEGTNVGREFDYRKHIGGHPQTSQRAVWKFASVPSGLSGGRAGTGVPMEMTFDIMRMTKGQENRGVFIEVQVFTPNAKLDPPPNTGGTPSGDGEWVWADKAKKVEYTKAAVAKLGLENDPIVKDWARNNSWDEVYSQRVRPRTRGVTPRDKDWKVVDELAEEFGIFEIAGKEVYDYHPERIAVPAGLFRNAQKAAGPDAPVTVLVKCTTPGQMLGMADADLYFLENDPKPSATGFAQNYFKSAFGLWCRVCLVIGLAVCCSTYLSGVIAFLAAAFLFLAGFFSDHLADMATGKSFAGGPFQAMNQLLEAKSSTTPMDQANPLTKVALGGDAAFSWLVRRFINLVPDVDAFSWTAFVGEGFNVPLEYLVMNFVVLVGYLLPWFVLGFYLMRSREVAA